MSIKPPFNMKSLVFYMATSDAGIENWLMEHGHVITSFPAMAEVIMFPGGSDVWPSLYNQKPIKGTHYDIERDKKELELYINHPDIPKVGICRGGQFLNVMAGGKMWQDVDKHTCGIHDAWCHLTNKSVLVTSTHHQMMIPTSGGEILMTANRTTYKQSQFGFYRVVKDQPLGIKGADVEVIWYEGERNLCYQPHPEYEVEECSNHFWVVFEEKIYPHIVS